MGNFFKSVSVGVMMLLNIIVAALYLACSFAPYMHPKTWWFTGFLGLFFPLSFCTAVALPFVLDFCSHQVGLFPLAGDAGWFFSSKQTRFFQGEAMIFRWRNSPASIRFMSWNLRHFIPFDESMFKPDQDKHLQLILDQVKKYQPDVICFQEFVSMPGEGRQRSDALSRTCTWIQVSSICRRGYF
jgi:hypothetical protein